MNVLIPLLFVIIFITGRYTIAKRELPTVRVYGDHYLPVRRLVAYFILIFVSAFRYNVGYDYRQYWLIFLANTSPVNIFTGYLKGTQNFGITTKLIFDIAIILKKPEVIYLIFSVFTLLLFFDSLERESEEKYESLIIFICLFYLNTFSTMRQSAACALVFWGFKFVRKKKIVPYIIVIALACTIHSIALVALPIYFIFNYLDFKKSAIITLILILGGKVILPRLLSTSYFSHYQSYIDGTIGNNGGSKITYIYIAIIIVVIIFSLFYTDRDDLVWKYLSIIIIGVAFPFIVGTQNGGRVSEFYYEYLMLVIPMLFNRILWKNMFSRMMALVPFDLYYIVFLIVDYTNESGYTPFQFIFWR